MPEKPFFISSKAFAACALFILTCAALFPVRAAAYEEWYEYYFQAEYAYRQGDYAACAARAELAFDRNTQSGTYVVKGVVVEYYPHHLLCQCYSQLHETEKAKCHCEAGVNDEKFEPCTCQCDVPATTIPNKIRVESTYDRQDMSAFALKRKIKDFEKSDNREEVIKTVYSGGTYEVPLTIDRTRKSAASKLASRPEPDESERTTLAIDSAGGGAGASTAATFEERMQEKRDKGATSSKAKTTATTSRRYVSRETAAEGPKDADEAAPTIVEKTVDEESESTNSANSAAKRRHTEESYEAVALGRAVRTDMSQDNREAKKKKKIKDALTVVTAAAVLYGAYELNRNEKKKLKAGDHEDPGGPKIKKFEMMYRSRKYFPDLQHAYAVGMTYEFSPQGQPVANVYLNTTLICTTKFRDPMYRQSCNGPYTSFVETDMYGTIDMTLLGVDANGKSASKFFRLYLPKPGD